MNAREPCGICRTTPATGMLFGVPVCDGCSATIEETMEGEA